ncbi:hypothetical protein GLIP_3771 [Aliiglaciecola lipolytica E3]|uniref:Uncharacterized protein n=1 Tax=Aliiglaciecola lipolytica E3 TaxID=1127673 RepID=K6YE01_9ALTE|nr:hypothetical protein GLIP_3771 [Aliiglaciecola lipolytica E3]
MLGFDASFEVVDDCIYLKSLMTTHDDNHIALPIEPTGESSIETDVEWEHVSLEDLIKPAPGVGKSGPPPELNGINPQKSYAKQWFYEDVMMPLTYTGSLHLSTREMLETAINDELFQAPNGWLLECDNGRVIEARKIDNLNALFDEKT